MHDSSIIAVRIVGIQEYFTVNSSSEISLYEYLDAIARYRALFINISHPPAYIHNFEILLDVNHAKNSHTVSIAIS